MADKCVACGLTNGTLDLPGGRIDETAHWVVEHTIGPFFVGTLIVKPLRHVVHVWELTAEESAELGPLLVRITGAIHALLAPDQVYVCLWSHMGWEPVHVHFVLQPSWNRLRAEHARPGLFLQADLTTANVPLPRAEVEDFAERARAQLRAGRV